MNSSEHDHRLDMASGGQLPGAGGALAPLVDVDAILVVDAAPAVEPSTPPGPGLPEAVGWTALVLASQVIAMIAVSIVVVVVLVLARGGDVQPHSFQFDFQDLGPNLTTLLVGSPGFLCYAVLIPLACWRISPQPLRKLNFAAPSATQLLIACSCVLPVGFLSDALYTLVLPLWEWFLDQAPALNWMSEIGLAETMKQLNGASLPLLLFFLAVVPAIGEEWMLRGLVGRGLVARWGAWRGILLTSVLFAVMHLDPPHVAAVFPIGVMIHIIYLATRSFWMPILFHFLNNATVSFFTSLGLAQPGDPNAEISWWAVAALPYVTVAIVLLLRLRTRYVAADGATVERGYTTCEHFPESAARRVTPNQPAIAAVFGLLLAVQVGLLVLDVWSATGVPPAPEAVDGAQPAAASAMWVPVN